MQTRPLHRQKPAAPQLSAESLTLSMSYNRCATVYAPLSKHIKRLEQPRNVLRTKVGSKLRTVPSNLLISFNMQSWHAACIYIGYIFHVSRRDAMTPEFVTISIISVAFGVSVGYLIGIINYLADNGWRFDELV